MKKTGKKYVGVKEIAKIANVSIGTVDRAIHNRPGVSEKTRKKILNIIKEVKFQPNILASRLASKKIFDIAVIIPKVSEQTLFWEAPLKGIERANEEVKQYGIYLHYYFFDLKDVGSFTDQISQMWKEKVDGVLFSTWFTKEAGLFAEECQKKNVPFVLIDDILPNIEGLSYVGPHLFKSGFQAGQLTDLCVKENQSLMVLNIARDIDNAEIEKGFRGYFKEHGKPHKILRKDIKQVSEESISKEIKDLLQTNPNLGAIFVMNSRVGTVAKCLEEKNIRDLTLVGYDLTNENVEYLEKGMIQFLICHQPEEQGYLGVMTFYRYFVLSSQVPKLQYMPIDIITPWNYSFYNN